MSVFFELAQQASHCTTGISPCGLFIVDISCQSIVSGDVLGGDMMNECSRLDDFLFTENKDHIIAIT